MSGDLLALSLRAGSVAFLDVPFLALAELELVATTEKPYQPGCGKVRTLGPSVLLGGLDLHDDRDDHRTTFGAITDKFAERLASATLHLSDVRAWRECP